MELYLTTHTRNWHTQCGTLQELHTKKKITRKAAEKQRNGSYNKHITILYMAELNKMFKLSKELWFEFTNLCQGQQTTINTGVKGTELRYRIQRKYLTKLGIYTARYGRYKLSDEFYGQLQNIYDKSLQK